MLLPLVRVHGDVRQHINRRFKHIKAPIRAGVMKTVTRVAGLDVQAKGFSEAVRAAQMGMARTAALVGSDEHSVVVRRVLVEQFSAGEVGNHVGTQPARFEKIRKDAVHIRVRNGRRKGLLIDLFLLFRLRINRLHALAQQHGHGFDVAFAVIFLHKANGATPLIRGMVKPLEAAHRNAVVAGKPLFAPGLDELFALPEKKLFEINGRGALFLFWGKFYVLCQNAPPVTVMFDRNFVHGHPVYAPLPAAFA